MRKLLYLLLASFVIYSCEKDETEGINDLKKLIQPLEVGYNWTFIDSTFDNEGTLTKVDTSTVSVIGSEIVNYDGKQIELFFWKWDFYERIWLYVNEEENLYKYGLRDDNKNYIITQSLNQPYPVNIGDTWSSYHFNLQVENDTTFGVIRDTTEYECIYKDYTLNTKIGNLECIVKHTSDDLGERYIYYSPNIGYVGLENRVDGIIRFKKTLMNYDFSRKQDLSKVMKSAQRESKKNLHLDNFGLKINE